MAISDTSFLRGFTFAFGLFQNYYETHLLTSHSPSEISWIGTIASYLLIVIGVISGPLFDLGYYRAMLFGGAVMACFGIFMLSLAKVYYQILLTQGVCTGLGCGVLFIPGMALVSRSFKARRAVALGLISCGAPFGGSRPLRKGRTQLANTSNRRHHLHDRFRAVDRLVRLRVDCESHGLHNDWYIHYRVSSIALGSEQLRRYQLWNDPEALR